MSVLPSRFFLFLSGLPSTATLSDLHKSLPPNPFIIAIQVSVKPGPRYAVIEYSRIEEMQFAINTLNGTLLLGSIVYAAEFRYNPERFNEFKVQVTGFPQGTTEDEVKKKLEKYGIVTGVRMQRDPNGIAVRHAIVAFAMKESAGFAVDGDKSERWNEHMMKCIRISRIDSYDVMKAKKTGWGKTIIVKGFPRSSSEEELRTVFQPFGDIESIFIVPIDYRKTHFAFASISYRSAKSAHAACKKMHESSYLNASLTVKKYNIKRKLLAGNRDTTLVITHLPSTIVEEMLYAICEPFGVIVSTSIANFRNITAFVHFREKEELNQALEVLKITRVIGRELRVARWMNEEEQYFEKTKLIRRFKFSIDY